MLAELAAFNAAYGTIRTLIKNGKEVSDCMQQMGIIAGAKEDLERKLNKKRSGLLASVSSRTASDYEEFAALEKIREAEERLREEIIWAGRPGQWSDWLKFQAEARKRRREAEEKRRKTINKIIEVGALTVGVIVLGAIAFFVFWLAWQVRAK